MCQNLLTCQPRILLKGVISAEDLKFAMTGVGMASSDEEVAEMIAEIDEDQSGSINFDEFVVMMKTRMDETDPEKELKEAFNVFDLDKDGLIHWKELKVTLEKLGSELTSNEVHDMVMDMDDDGVINYEKFKKMMLKGGGN